MTQKKVVSVSQLQIAIAGAGATGVELAAGLHASTRQLVEFGLDRTVPEKHLKITIVIHVVRLY